MIVYYCFVVVFVYLFNIPTGPIILAIPCCYFSSGRKAQWGFIFHSVKLKTLGTTGIDSKCLLKESKIISG